ncbi:MAG TPA: DUF3574 domain-containing protein [Vicinamibacterales bacterium]|nr:DUF3574 domain-containing protein [Vicinamibacterales bacterium]
MRLRLAAIVAVTFTIGALVGGGIATRVTAQAPPLVTCGRASAPQLRTTLYFGTARPKGSVTELEWQLFLRDEVTRRFPDGLTVWDAEGQWRTAGGAVDHERSKVLLLVHPDTGAARESVQALIAKYRQQFEQESVLWETARVCVAS